MRSKGTWTKENHPKPFLGKHFSLEHRLNLSKSQKGRKVSEETKKKMSLSASKRRASKETKLKMSIARKGKKFTEIHKEKIRQAHIKRIQEQQISGWFKPSKTETYLLDKIESVINRKIQRQFYLERFFFDGKIDDYLIEIDGQYWHKSKEKDEVKDAIAAKNNFKLIRISVRRMSDALMFDLTNIINTVDTIDKSK